MGFSLTSQEVKNRIFPWAPKRMDLTTWGQQPQKWINANQTKIALRFARKQTLLTVSFQSYNAQERIS